MGASAATPFGNVCRGIVQKPASFKRCKSDPGAQPPRSQLCDRETGRTGLPTVEQASSRCAPEPGAHAAGRLSASSGGRRDWGLSGGGDHASDFPGTLQRWKVVEHQKAKPTEPPDAKFSSEKPICMGILMGASDRFAFAETGPAVVSAGRDAAATEIGGDQVQLERHGEGSVPAGPDVSAAFRGPYTCEGD